MSLQRSCHPYPTFCLVAIFKVETTELELELELSPQRRCHPHQKPKKNTPALQRTHSYTSHLSSPTFLTVDFMLFYLYTHHVLDGAWYLGHIVSQHIHRQEFPVKDRCKKSVMRFATPEDRLQEPISALEARAKSCFRRAWTCKIEFLSKVFEFVVLRHFRRHG